MGISLLLSLCLWGSPGARTGVALAHTFTAAASSFHFTRNSSWFPFDFSLAPWRRSNVPLNFQIGGLFGTPITQLSHVTPLPLQNTV